MVQKIRQTDKKIPVIFLSQHNEQEILLECINLYIDGYVLKPIIYDDLLQVIEKALVKVKLEFEKENEYRQIVNSIKPLLSN